MITWSVSVCESQSCFEDETSRETFARILEDLEPQHQWSHFMRETLLEICKGNIVALGAKIERWKATYARNNLILCSWLDFCKTSEMSQNEYENAVRLCLSIGLTSIQKASKDLVEGVFLKWLDKEKLSDNNENPLQILTRQSLYGSMWVIPYLWELYQWLSTQQTSYNISEDQAKMLTIRAMLDEENREYFDYTLWTKVKVGVNHYLQGAGRESECLCDDVRFIDLISVSYGTHETHGKLLSILFEMIDDYNAILGRQSDAIEIPETSWDSLQLQPFVPYPGTSVSIEKIEYSGISLFGGNL